MLTVVPASLAVGAVPERLAGFRSASLTCFGYSGVKYIFLYPLTAAILAAC